MEIQLTDERRKALVGHLQTLFSGEFDEDLSDFRASEVVDLMLTTLGPLVYNQAVEDVRAHFQARLDDLSGELHVEGQIG